MSDILPLQPPAALQASTIIAQPGCSDPIISEEVGAPPRELKHNDDLVDLGVDSLLALTMPDRINEIFNVTVDSAMS